jgi:hypothetical protein
LILAALHPERGRLVTRGVMDRGLSAMARAGLAGHVGACPFVIARIGALILSLPDIEKAAVLSDPMAEASRMRTDAPSSKLSTEPDGKA